MEREWSLKELYLSFDSEDFQQDFLSLDRMLQSLEDWVEGNLNSTADSRVKAEDMVNYLQTFYKKYVMISAYASLVQSVDVKNERAGKVLDQLGNKKARLAGPRVRFQKWLAALPDLDSLVASSELLQEHDFMLRELVEESAYLLTEDEEIIIARLANTGSRAWSELQQLLTSTLLVELDGEELPLSVVRNMADDRDPEKRKQAYQAELAAYQKIEDAVAASLNSLKGEVITVSGRRGFNSPLEKTLFDSRMDSETLEALLAAMRESLPDFQRYYRRKAELLGHSGGLPFYDLFAPLGRIEMEFTYEEAAGFIVDNFRSFSDELADFASRAFADNWIDVDPRKGKSGGAFCYNIHPIGESRVLTNFNGSFNSLTTLAHELGHGYHGNCLMEESILNSSYPMPLAETASIFCETIVENAALKGAAEDEAFAILENSISTAGQVIVDIYSRFLFEKNLFERREVAPLTVSELKGMMLEAQKEAYGEGLDPEYLHPYMWVCKSHYYYAGRNYYNFPYAFGLLFGKGLYALYLETGQDFAADYKRMLAVTGKRKAAEVAAMMGIDIRSLDFWRGSLRLIKGDIDRFIELSTKG